MLNLIKRFWPWLVVPIALLIVIALFALVLGLLPFSADWIKGSYDNSFGNFSFPQADEESLPYIYIAVMSVTIGLMGLIVTASTIFITAFINVGAINHARKLQDTQKILLNTRLSDQFQKQREIIDLHFPPGNTDSTKALSIYTTTNLSKEDAEIKNAIVFFLNHYEFLAMGILEGHLDEATLRKSLRGIVCGWVFDMREVIHHIRVVEGKELAFENLVKVYFMWVIQEAGNGEWEDGIALGPT